MDRYSATRLVSRICVLALAIGPARGQVQVGELMVTPAADGVTVTLAQVEPPRPALQQEPREEPQQGSQQSQQSQQEQQEQQDRQAWRQERQFQSEDSMPAPAPHAAQVTRISLSVDELPPEPAVQSSARPLPPLPAPRSHEMERDVLTLKAAHAAMLLDDQLHQHNKLAALR